jgi:uncharacterized protein (DUF58 family)
MEYAESREYVAGDDARHIDWRVTARTGRAHTKLFQAERERVSLIVADTSPALYFGTRVRFKSAGGTRGRRRRMVGAASRRPRGRLRGSDREAPIAPAGGPRVLRVLDALTRWYTAARRRSRPGARAGSCRPRAAPRGAHAGAGRSAAGHPDSAAR